MSRPSLALAVLLAAAPSAAQEGRTVDIGGLLDLRYARTGAARSWLDGGWGRLRHGSAGAGEAERLTLAQGSLLVDAPLGELASVHLQLNADADPDAAVGRPSVGLVEAFASWRPEPSPNVRFRGRAGVFFPPVSLENTGPAWTPVATITPSAINAWIGEEVRATGAEGRLGVRAREHELWALGGVFGVNDPAGSLLAWRGWALHDRQTAVFDKLPLPALPSIGPGGIFADQAPWVAPLREIDGRIGWYAGGGARIGRGLEVQGLRWDNRGEPTRFDGFQYAWHTAFTSAGARLRVGVLEGLGQWMEGRTRMGQLAGPTTAVDAAFEASYGLVSLTVGRHRMAARYDRFRVDDHDVHRVQDDNGDDGEAWTAAYTLRLGAAHRVALEWLRVTSTRPARARAGLPEREQERMVQASVRVVF